VNNCHTQVLINDIVTNHTSLGKLSFRVSLQKQRMWPRFVIRPSRAMLSKFFLSLDNIGHRIASSWLVPVCKNCVENLKTISYGNGEFLKGQGEGPNFGRMGLKLIPNLIPGWTTHLRAQGVRVREALGFGVCFFAKKSCPD
jgi:hypothetical protein